MLNTTRGMRYVAGYSRYIPEALEYGGLSSKRDFLLVVQRARLLVHCEVEHGAVSQSAQQVAYAFQHADQQRAGDYFCKIRTLFYNNHT